MPDEQEEHQEYEDDAPWTEERWEAFMKESDLRSARYGELFETLHDDPDGEEKIAKEMGWDLDDDFEDKPWVKEFNEQAAEVMKEIEAEKAAKEEAKAAGGEDADTAEEDPFADDDVDTIPAYRLAYESGLKIHDKLEEASKKYWADDSGDDENVDAETDDIRRLLGAASIGCNIGAAKIAGGHSMGYEDDVLCGNIVNCRRGLAGVDEGIEALEELQRRNVLTAQLAKELIALSTAVREAIEARIVELRSRVWWS